MAKRCLRISAPPLRGGFRSYWIVAALLGAAAAASAEDAKTVRVAQFNVWELGASKIDQVDAEGRGAHPQLLAAARVVRHVRPDVLLLNEIDYDPERDLARAFIDAYLATGEGEAPPIDYPYVYVGPVNTGVPSGYDLNNNGVRSDPDDAWGYGAYPGQYGMALLSRWPLDLDGLRTFRALRWITMPGHKIPDGRDGRPEWYDAEEAALLRLVSKSFWDVPVEIPVGDGVARLHVLASHPTPPVFDGEEDRNGRRNFDEIRLLADYLRGGEAAHWIVDDRGRRGGLDGPETGGASAVVLGDLNADPVRGDAPYEMPAIRQLLAHPRLQDPAPRSSGDLGVDPERGAYPGESRSRTSSFGRIDYALPTHDLEVVASGVFLPAEGEPLADAVRGDAVNGDPAHVNPERRASDHLLVWVDLRLRACSSS